MSGRWQRLIRFIPKNENFALYGELINDHVESPRQFPRKVEGLKAKVFKIENINDEFYEETGEVKEVEDVCVSEIVIRLC